MTTTFKFATLPIGKPSIGQKCLIFIVYIFIWFHKWPLILFIHGQVICTMLSLAAPPLSYLPSFLPQTTPTPTPTQPQTSFFTLFLTVGRVLASKLLPLLHSYLSLKKIHRLNDQWLYWLFLFLWFNLLKWQ